MPEAKATLSQLIEKFRERLDELVEDDDIEPETRGALSDIDKVLGLLERAIADFKISLTKLIE